MTLGHTQYIQAFILNLHLIINFMHEETDIYYNYTKDSTVNTQYFLPARLVAALDHKRHLPPNTNSLPLSRKLFIVENVTLVFREYRSRAVTFRDTKYKI
jgi:hypothetical protein